jgi:hypothetical protein
MENLMVQSVPDPKNMAKALRSELLSRFEVDAAHSECLEIVARQHGVDNWNILAAQKRANAESEAGECRADERRSEHRTSVGRPHRHDSGNADLCG